MKVVRWISADEAEGMVESFGGLGGWFNAEMLTKPGSAGGHGWKDYLENLPNECDTKGAERAEALREAIIDRRMWVTGDWHQCPGDDCVPVFDDETVASFSFRAWGDLLAAVWTEQLGRPYHYMDFYYATPPAKPADFEVRASRGAHAQTT